MTKTILNLSKAWQKSGRFCQALDINQTAGFRVFSEEWKQKRRKAFCVFDKNCPSFVKALTNFGIVLTSLDKKSGILSKLVRGFLKLLTQKKADNINPSVDRLKRSVWTDQHEDISEAFRFLRTLGWAIGFSQQRMLKRHRRSVSTWKHPPVQHRLRP